MSIQTFVGKDYAGKDLKEMNCAATIIMILDAYVKEAPNSNIVVKVGPSDDAEVYSFLSASAAAKMFNGKWDKATSTLELDMTATATASIKAGRVIAQSGPALFLLKKEDYDSLSPERKILYDAKFPPVKKGTKMVPQYAS